VADAKSVVDAFHQLAVLQWVRLKNSKTDIVQTILAGLSLLFSVR
jgi:hypothetical protein